MYKFIQGNSYKMRNWIDYNNLLRNDEIIKEIPRVAIVGCFQNGKSTLINCLLDGIYALPGDGRATTSIATRYGYSYNTEIYYRHVSGELIQTTMDKILQKRIQNNLSLTNAFQAEVFLNKTLLKGIELVDTPGFNANDTDSNIANCSLEDVDYAIFVTTNQSMTIGEKKVLNIIKGKGIPFVLIVNCMKSGSSAKWLPSHKVNKEIAEDIKCDLLQADIIPEEINNEKIHLCNLLWYWSTRNSFNESIKYIPDGKHLKNDISNVLKKNINIEASERAIIEYSQFRPIVDYLQNRLKNFDALTERVKN